jgi:DNA-binding MarR family transcriptional regulator
MTNFGELITPIAPRSAECSPYESANDTFYGVDLVRMIHLLANTYETVVDEQLSHVQLTGARWSLLLRLWRAEKLGNYSVRPTQLSHFQRVSKNTISSHLRSLEEQGLIERDIDPQDKRQFRICLSDAGRALVQATAAEHLQFLNKLTADLNPEEIANLRELLQRLHHSILRHGQVMVDCPAPPG